VKERGTLARDVGNGRRLLRNKVERVLYRGGRENPAADTSATTSKLNYVAGLM